MTMIQTVEPWVFWGLATVQSVALILHWCCRKRRPSLSLAALRVAGLATALLTVVIWPQLWQLFTHLALLWQVLFTNH